MLEALSKINQQYGIATLLNDFKRQASEENDLTSELKKLIEGKLELTQLATKSKTEHGSAQVLEFRQQLELQWGLQNQLDDLYQSIAQREEALYDLIAVNREQREHSDLKKTASFRAEATFCGAFITSALLLKEIVFFYMLELKILQVVDFPGQINHSEIHYAEAGIIVVALLVVAFAYWHEKKPFNHQNSEHSEAREKAIHHAMHNKRQRRH